MSDDGRIVCGVAVNGSPAAVALAAREAERTGCVLHLVHIRSPLSVDVEERALERARDAALAARASPGGDHRDSSRTTGSPPRWPGPRRAPAAS